MALSILTDQDSAALWFELVKTQCLLNKALEQMNVEFTRESQQQANVEAYNVVKKKFPHLGIEIPQEATPQHLRERVKDEKVEEIPKEESPQNG